MRICLVRTIDIMKFTSENFATQFKTQNKYFRHGNLFSRKRQILSSEKNYAIKNHLFKVEQSKIRIYATAFGYLASVSIVTEKQLSH